MIQFNINKIIIIQSHIHELCTTFNSGSKYIQFMNAKATAQTQIYWQLKKDNGI